VPIHIGFPTCTRNMVDNYPLCRMTSSIKQSRERERERVFALLLPSLKQMLMVSPVVDCSVVIPHRKSTQVRKTPLSLQNFWSCGKTVFNSTSLSSFMSTKVEETKIRTFLFLFFFSSLWPLHVIVNEKGTRKK